MSKIIIGIHGLGNKPPREILEKWWLQSICEGLTKIERFKFEPKFELVYWGDILNDKPLNRLIKDPENPYYLDEPYSQSPIEMERKTHPTRKKFLGFLEEQMDKIFLNEDLSQNFEFLSDMIFKKYFKELEIYYAEQPDVNDASFKSVKDIIRDRLVKVLTKHKDKKILLIAHSMGSIIAYDVCSLVAPKINVDTFVTMGSPLGIPIIVSKIAEEIKIYHPETVKLRTPKNIISNWFNFSDVEDNVALNYNLSDDFESSESGIKVKDILVDNDYMINDNRNPHKSYGYLRAPQFSNMLADFLEKDDSYFKLWRQQKYFEMSKYIKDLKLFGRDETYE